MKVTVTGHRPPEIGGYIVPNPTYDFIMDATKRIFLTLKPEKIIVGGALGMDIWAAQCAYDLGIPYDLYVPFLGQESIWPEKSQEEYRLMRSRAADVIVVCGGNYAAWKMQKRNEAMVNQLNNPEDRLVSCWNGNREGGTFNCVKYALSQNKKMIQINPLTKEIIGLGEQ